MVDEGWGNGDPRVRLAQLDEALLRECRYVVGVKLHTQGMTLKAAEQLFTGQCFQTPQVAVEESLRGTQDPMYGYYTLGKLMILKLRADYRRRWVRQRLRCRSSTTSCSRAATRRSRCCAPLSSAARTTANLCDLRQHRARRLIKRPLH